jgi:predicted membrane-bound mannosyltransferase
MKSNRGSSEVIILVVLLAAAAGFIKLPALFDRDTKRAEQSQQTTEELLRVQQAQGASAAAGVVEIGTANAMAEDSPSKDFITREVPSVLSKLPAPDPAALLEAERRRIAVMEGRIEEANRLYGEEARRSERLARDLAEAIAAKRLSDQALLEAAAARRAAEQQMRIIIVIAGLLLALWLYAYATRIGRKSIALMANDIRSGERPIVAIDAHVPDYLKPSIHREAKLAMEVKDN